MINVDKVCKKIRKILGEDYKADIAMILGSGLSDAKPDLNNVKVISYEDIGLPKSKVVGHSGKFVFGEFAGKNIVIASRFHYYESGDLNKVKTPHMILKALGVKTLVVTCACGAVNESYKPGDLMLITDQINLSGQNPLIGMDEIKFVDMTEAYNLDYRNLIKDIANKNSIKLQEGVFVQMSGPTYETPAEIKFIRTIGGDAVSMSTSIEVIYARYLDIKVVGFSAITNMGAGITGQQLNHEEVLINSKMIVSNLKTILTEFVQKIDE